MNRKLLVLVLALLAGMMLVAGGSAAAAPPPALALSGTLGILWGDAADGTSSPPLYFLYRTGHEPLALLPGDVAPGRLLDLNGHNVWVEVQRDMASASKPLLPLTLTGIQLIDGRGLTATPPFPTGNSPWIILGCQFPDVAASPLAMDYFLGMFRNEYPGLDHYWREASYGQLNLDGTDAMGWFTLPRAREAYFSGGELKTWEMVNDCTAVADPAVDFSQYAGISFIYNSTANHAYGGPIMRNLDGEDRIFAAIWMPTWSHTVMSLHMHEMGHGYRLPHSASARGETYDNVWDVMADDRYNCRGGNDNPFIDVDYGCIGQHTIVYHRERLGWFAPEQIYNASAGSHTVNLVDANAAPAVAGYRMVRIPIDGSTTHFYTVEVRRLYGYDAKLPTNAVILHDVATVTRQDPAWIVDPLAVEEGYTADGVNSGAQWQPGETFAIANGNIVVRVERETADGYQLTIVNQADRAVKELLPQADTYTNSSAPTINYGKEQQLLVRRKDTYRAFLRFDPAAIDNGAPLAMTLRMRLLNPTAQELLGVAVASPDTYAGTTTRWTETGLTYNNAPDRFGFRAQPKLVEPLLVEWDLTPSIPIVSESYPLFTLSIHRTTSDSGQAAYESRESDNPPRLWVEYLVVPTSEEPVPHTFTPTNDTFVRRSRPDTVYGKHALINAKGGQRDAVAFIKFNVKGLEGTVEQAMLRLLVKNPSPGGGEVLAVSPYYAGTTDQWLETGLTWNNAPGLIGSPLADLGRVRRHHWVEVDVTQSVVEALADTSGRVSFAIRSDSYNAVAYSSKEGTSPPELVVLTR